MSLLDLCDVSYVMQVEQIERRLVPLAAALQAAGRDASGLVDGARERFDAALNEDPTVASGLLESLRREAGVA